MSRLYTGYRRRLIFQGSHELESCYELGRRLTLEGELVAASTASAPQFRSGTRVRHEKFGEGTVTLVDGNKLTIDFDDGSTKRVVASFVDLA